MSKQDKRDKLLQARREAELYGRQADRCKDFGNIYGVPMYRLFTVIPSGAKKFSALHYNASDVRRYFREKNFLALPKDPYHIVELTPFYFLPINEGFTPVYIGHCEKCIQLIIAAPPEIETEKILDVLIEYAKNKKVRKALL